MIVNLENTLASIDALVLTYEKALSALHEARSLIVGLNAIEPSMAAPRPKKPARPRQSKKPSKKGNAAPAESDEVEADIDGHAVMLTEKQSAFITALSQADDCVSRPQARKILGNSDPVFYSKLKDLKARIAKLGFEINMYHGKGYRLEKDQPA